MLKFEQLHTEGIAQLSYFVGDTTTGTACVIDPRPDVEIYLEMARHNQVVITHVFETHIHADFMSGARELADRTGTAEIYVSEEGGAEYGFECNKIRDGAEFEFGKCLIRAHLTPGHTPEHLSYSVAEKDHPEHPWGICTGDSLFVGSAGRPDLLGDKSDELAEQLYHTLYDFFANQPDDLIIYPCHGAGSACGAGIGDRLSSTIGYEKRFNEFLQYDDMEKFKKFVIEGAPHEPAHYSRHKKLNGEGPPVLGNLPKVPAMTPEEFQKAKDASDTQLVDTRQMLAFGGGHIDGALNIGDRPELSNWAGEMLDADKELLLVMEDEEDLYRIVPLFLRVGLWKFRGYLAGGMKAWGNAGLPLRKIPQMTVHEVKNHLDDLQILDVRDGGEWDGGHIPGAIHRPVADMRDKIENVDRNGPTVTYCGSGYRASLAASLLQIHGYDNVRNVPGSYGAWKKSNYPVEGNGSQ